MQAIERPIVKIKTVDSIFGEGVHVYDGVIGRLLVGWMFIAFV